MVANRKGSRRLLTVQLDSDIECVIAKRHTMSQTCFHQWLRSFLRNPNRVRNADLLQSENVVTSRRLYAERLRPRREIAVGDQILKHGGVEMHDPDPIFANIDLRPWGGGGATDDGVVRLDGQSSDTGAGYNKVESLRKKMVR
ncbi:uncharacterized protein G2W53_014855 [Senna tora]|uniref:Uncharacterized protein n=1 Tax=Senna tora TaxID=362788 RepID=A0A834WUC3_9FABA|nr:uncharacterized protein G2W53_014855 [Senna tora]